MDDLISREQAIEALKDVSEHYTEKGREWHPHVDFMVQAIKELPSAEPTLYGYKIEHLAMIAIVMQKENVTPQKAVEIFRGISGIVQIIMDEQEERIKKAVEQWMI